MTFLSIFIAWLGTMVPSFSAPCVVTSQISKARLGAALLGGAVYGDKSEGHGVAFLPLKVIQQAPMAISHNGNAVRNAAFHTGQRLLDISCTAGIRQL